MKIYRIYKIVQDFEWSPYNDDMSQQVDRDVTIKYVDSKEKVNEFLADIEKANRPAEKCYHCPLLSLTKRQYNNGNHNMLISTYWCDYKDIIFDGNSVLCNNFKQMDMTEYNYEEIEVE